MKTTLFSKEDQIQIAQFWRDIYSEMGWNVAYIDGLDDPLKYFHSPEGFLLVGKGEKVVVGCGGIKPLSAGDAVMKRFYIAKNYRGTGLAKQLLDELIMESKKRGFSRLVLDVYYKNPRAMRFYEKHGFTKFSPEPNQDWQESALPEKFVYYFFDVAKK